MKQSQQQQYQQRNSQRNTYRIQNKWSKKLEDLQENLDGIKSLKNSLRHTIDELKDNNNLNQNDKENYNSQTQSYLKQQQQQQQNLYKTQCKETEYEDTSESVQIKDITNTSLKKNPQQQQEYLQKKQEFQYKSNVPQYKQIGSIQASKVLTLQNDDTDDTYGPINENDIGQQDYRSTQKQKYQIQYTEVYNNLNTQQNQGNNRQSLYSEGLYCRDMQEVLEFMNQQNIQIDSNLVQTKTIGSWLRDLNLDQYIQNFADNGIYENKSLVEYFNKQQDWHKLLISLFGIDKHGYRTKIILKILQECEVLESEDEQVIESCIKAVENLYSIKEKNQEFSPEQIKQKMLQYYTKITSKRKNQDDQEQQQQTQDKNMVEKFLKSINLEHYLENFIETGYDDFYHILQQHINFIPFDVEYMNSHLQMEGDIDAQNFIQALDQIINPANILDQQGQYRPCSILKPCGMDKQCSAQQQQSECQIF